MMVKSLSQLNHGQYNLKKKKVWIKVDNSDDHELQVEYEVDIIDLSFYTIFLYNKQGKITLHKMQRQQKLDIIV